MEKKKTVLIVSGEASGDMHAAELVKALRRKNPGLEFFGLGGKLSAQQGVRLIHDLTSMAVVGFVEVLKNYGKFRQIFRKTLAEADSRKPDLAILVDYPGFNLALAKELKLRGIPVIYYSSPQVWAWGKGRIKTIKQTIAKMIVFFPFEEKLYRSFGVPVEFVGHPLLDVVAAKTPRDALLAREGLSRDKLTVALLPGSRKKEVKTLLPVMLRTASLINAYMLGRVQFVVPAAATVPEWMFRKYLKGIKLPVALVKNATYDCVAASDFALVCSGTATLETGLLGVPLAVMYKINLLSWLFVRMLVTVSSIGLINLVLGRKVCEEFIQFECTPGNIADCVIPVLQDEDRRSMLKLELAKARSLLGKPGAADRAADIVLSHLS